MGGDPFRFKFGRGEEIIGALEDRVREVIGETVPIWTGESRTVRGGPPPAGRAARLRCGDGTKRRLEQPGITCASLRKRRQPARGFPAGGPVASALHWSEVGVRAPEGLTDRQQRLDRVAVRPGRLGLGGPADDRKQAEPLGLDLRPPSVKSAQSSGVGS